MRSFLAFLAPVGLALFVGTSNLSAAGPDAPVAAPPAEVDAEVRRLMAKANVPGLAIAFLREGRPVWIGSWGMREVEGAKPLQTDTVMYAASLTKLAFTYTVMQLVDEGTLRLDEPIEKYLKKPLPEYSKYAELAADERWRKLTPRMLLAHTPGFPNFRFINADGKLDIKFEPGTRYAYSGEGINLLQFVLEQGLGLDLGAEMQRRVFDRFGLTRTSMTWRDDFAGNVTQGYDWDGVLQPHNRRQSVRAAGSMDTTIADYANFFAGFLRGDGLSSSAHAEMLRPQIPIEAAHQFPTFERKAYPKAAAIGFSGVLGGLIVRGPQGPVFWKGGHDDGTANLAIGLPAKRTGIVMMSNSVRAELIYPALARLLLGETGLPWDWEYNPEGRPPPVW